jgi:hypothetical protein
MNNRLKNYLALTAGFVAISPLADAQIIYTDLNPDLVLGGWESSFQLDINKDSIFDFLVYHRKNRDYGTWYTNNFIGVIGKGQVLSAGDSIGKSWLYRPKAMNLNDEMITSPPNSEWKRGGSLSRFEGLQDKYVGFRFKINNNIHYGWARLDVAASDRSIILKEYAYNTQAEKLLRAGSTKVSLPEENSSKNILVYSNGSCLRIEAPVDQSLTGRIRLTDLNGRELRSVDVNNEKKVQLNTQELSPGVYIVNIVTGNGILNKKVLIR